MFEIQYIKLAKCELEYLDCKLNIHVFKTRKNLTVDIFIVILPGKKNSDQCLVLIFLSLVTSTFAILYPPFFLNEPESRMSVPIVKLKTIKK